MPKRTCTTAHKDISYDLRLKAVINPKVKYSYHDGDTQQLTLDLTTSLFHPCMSKRVIYPPTCAPTHPYWDASQPRPAALWCTWTKPWHRAVPTPPRCPAAAVSCQPLLSEPVKTALWKQQVMLKGGHRRQETASDLPPLTLSLVLDALHRC